MKPILFLTCFIIVLLPALALADGEEPYCFTFNDEVLTNQPDWKTCPKDDEPGNAGNALLSGESSGVDPAVHFCREASLLTRRMVCQPGFPHWVKLPIASEQADAT